MARAIDRTRLKKLLGMLGSAHDGEVLNAARHITTLMTQAGITWDALIPDDQTAAEDGRSRWNGDARAADRAKLDRLLEAEGVSPVLKIRLAHMRAALIRGQLSEADRRMMRVLYRKAVLDGAVVDPA
jgi:hypothetical protein